MKNFKKIYLIGLLVLVSGRILAQESETHNTKTLTIKNNNATLRLESVNDSLNYKLELTNNYNASEKFYIRNGIQKSFGNKLIFGALPYNYMNDYYGLAFMTNTLNPDSTKVRMVINGVGNVGIGTRTPSDKLHIVGGNLLFNGNTTNGIKYNSGYALSVIRAGVDASFSSLKMDGNHGQEITWAVDNNNLSTFKSWNIIFGNTNVFKINNAGNVGIGTTTPDPGNKLEVSGRGQFLSDAMNVSLLLQSGSTSNNNILFRSNATTSNTQTNDWFVGNNLGNFTFYKSGLGDALKLNANGNIGIGTSSPTTKLEVNSTVNEVAIFKGTAGLSQVAFNNDANKEIKLYTYKSDYASGTYFSTNGPNESGIFQDANAPFFIGTRTVAQPLIFATNSSEKMRVLSNGQVGINTTTFPTDLNYKLAVGGNIIAEEVLIKLKTAWPDFVFSNKYKLKPLEEVEQFIKTNNHLPEIPSAKEVEAQGGQQLGEMNRLLLQKVEELTLYLIDQNKKLENQQKEIDALKAKIEK